MHLDLVDFTLNWERAKAFADRNGPDQPRKVRRAVALEVIRNQIKFKEYRQQKLEQTIRDMGVCCFSECATSHLMWSHYAVNHKGIVLGFNISPAYNNFGHFFFAQPVKYIHKIIRKNWYDEGERIIEHLVLTKSAVWSYEQEIRACYFNRNGKINFDPRCLKEVYFGCNTPAEHIQQITNLVSRNPYEDIGLNQMVIDNKIFDLKKVVIR